jgi:hypothetical protein
MIYVYKVVWVIFDIQSDFYYLPVHFNPGVTNYYINQFAKRLKTKTYYVKVLYWNIIKYIYHKSSP